MRHFKGEYTDKDLLDILKSYPTQPTSDKFTLDGSTPHPRTYAKRFGSFGNALELAGLSRNVGGLQLKPTKVYLVDFGDFYKIGITQRTIKERFIGYPDYSIVFYLELPTLILAIQKEREWKKTIVPYLYLPKHSRFERINGGGGKTECFQY